MKLRLKNFRCYLDREFDFGTEGLLLLSGASGTGKSTILMAITFTLYGLGTKVITHGKTSCQVELEHNELKIIRTKRPNRVIVINMITQEEYENDAGQGIINEKFGIAFETTSYIRQNAINSFITLSPTEKLEFLEKFAFTGFDLSQIKSRCSTNIRNTHEALTYVSGQLETLKNIYGAMKKPEKVSFPIPISKTGGRDHAIKNELIRHKNSKILVKKAEAELDTIKTWLTDLHVYNAKTEGRRENISTLQKNIGNITLELDNVHYDGDLALEKQEQKLALFISQRELLLLKDRYEQDKSRLELIYQSEIDEMKKKITTIEENLWKEYTEVEVEELINDHIDILKDAEQLKRLKTLLEKYSGINEEKLEENKQKLEEYRKTLLEKRELLSKLLLQKELYECPACHTSLRFQDDELHIQSDEIELNNDADIEEIEKEITLMAKSINRLEYSIPEDQNKLKRYKETQTEIKVIEDKREDELLTKEEAETNIEYLKEYKRTQQEQEKSKKKLETSIRDKKFSSTVDTFKTQLTKQKEAIKSLETKTKEQKHETIDEEDLRYTIQIQRQSKEKFEMYQKQLKTLNRDLKLNTEELEKLEEEYSKKYKTNKLVEQLEQEITEKETNLDKLKNDSMKHDSNVQKIEQYQRYKEESNKFTEWETKVLDCEEAETMARQKYSAGMLLKDKILQAESVAMANIISSINTHAQEYLELFFPVDPIEIRLQSFKQSKKSITGAVKPQINLEINYKGMEADLTMLSGGELARVVLAFCLSLAEIFNSPFLLLDECTASLDQELNSIVLEGIQKNFGQKLVIVIAHQVVSGDFDRQIML